MKSENREVSSTPGASIESRFESRLQGLLHELGARLRRGGLPLEEAPRLATGLQALDALLGGGFPRGRLCEIAGPASSGRTALALSLLARTTRAGTEAAWVDAADAFDPPSAAATGVVLERVLWVRAPRPAAALRSAERLIESRGFPLVVMDLACDVAPPPPLSPVAWTRLSRAAAGAEGTLVLLAGTRLAGPAAALALELRPLGARFGGPPDLLPGLAAEAALVRRRDGAPSDRLVALRLEAPPAA